LIRIPAVFEIFWLLSALIRASWPALAAPPHMTTASPAIETLRKVRLVKAMATALLPPIT